MAFRLSLLSLLILMIPCSVFAESIVFKLHGKEVKTLDLPSMKTLAGVKKLTVNELHTDEKVVYEGIAINALLEKVYGKTLSEGDEILFTCTDGYRPSVPLKRFSEHTGLLAFARADGKKFEFPNKDKNGEITNYGPFYLVWENMNDKALAKEGLEFWPYQLAKIDIIRFSDRFPNLAPPDKSSSQVKAGFVHFRSQCLSCHTINGEGGQKGIELNYPMSVAEYMKESVLIDWMKDPRKVRYNATMPQVNIGYANRDEMIRDIAAYLKAMAKNKRPPKDQDTK